MIKCLASLMSVALPRRWGSGGWGWGGRGGVRSGPLFISDIFLVPSHEMQHHLTNHNHSYCTYYEDFKRPKFRSSGWLHSKSDTYWKSPPVTTKRLADGASSQPEPVLIRPGHAGHGANNTCTKLSLSSLLECGGRDFTKHRVANRSLLLCIRAFSLLVAY